VRTGLYRPNLSIETTIVEEWLRNQALLESIGRNPPGAAIIYETLQQTAVKVANSLLQGMSALTYQSQPDSRVNCAARSRSGS